MYGFPIVYKDAIYGNLMRYIGQWRYQSKMATPLHWPRLWNSPSPGSERMSQLYTAPQPRPSLYAVMWFRTCSHTTTIWGWLCTHFIASLCYFGNCLILNLPHSKVKSTFGSSTPHHNYGTKTCSANVFPNFPKSSHFPYISLDVFILFPISPLYVPYIYLHVPSCSTHSFPTFHIFQVFRIWLVVSTPVKNMKVTWDDFSIPNCMGK